MLCGTDMEEWNDDVSTVGTDYSFPVLNFIKIHLLVSELKQTVTKIPEYTEIYDFSICVYQSTEFKQQQKFLKPSVPLLKCLCVTVICVFVPELPMNSNTEFWWA